MSDVAAQKGAAPVRSAQPALFQALATAFTVFVVGYILIPILVTIVMSFNDAGMIRFPISVWSLKWYQDFFGSAQWTDALKNSIIIALGTTVISTSAGISAAWAFERFHIPLKDLWYLLILIPLFMPGVVLGLGVAIAFGGWNFGGYSIYGSRELVMIAHSLCSWKQPFKPSTTASSKHPMISAASRCKLFLRSWFRWCQLVSFPRPCSPS
jgi:ABC-type spermidine/putrescine transport system permease subunit II